MLTSFQSAPVVERCCSWGCIENLTCHTQCMDLWAPAQHQWKWTSPSTVQETTFVFKAHSMLLGCQTISITRLTPKFSLRPWALGVALGVASGDSLRNAAVATTLTPHSSVSKWKVSHWNPGDKPNHSKNWRPSDWKPAEQQEHTAHCFGVAHLMPLPMLNWTKSESSLRIQVRPNSWITSQAGGKNIPEQTEKLNAGAMHTCPHASWMKKVTNPKVEELPLSTAWWDHPLQTSWPHWRSLSVKQISAKYIQQHSKQNITLTLTQLKQLVCQGSKWEVADAGCTLESA